MANDKLHLRGFNLVDKVARSSKLTTGGSSSMCVQPTGGDAGGDIKKVFSFFGASRNCREFFSLIGYNKL